MLSLDTPRACPDPISRLDCNKIWCTWLVCQCATASCLCVSTALVCWEELELWGSQVMVCMWEGGWGGVDILFRTFSYSVKRFAGACERTRRVTSCICYLFVWIFGVFRRTQEYLLPVASILVEGNRPVTWGNPQPSTDSYICIPWISPEIFI